MKTLLRVAGALLWLIVLALFMAAEKFPSTAAAATRKAAPPRASPLKEIMVDPKTVALAK